MKLNSNFIIHESGSGYILMDASSTFAGIVHLNETTVYILENLKEDVEKDELINRMALEYDASTEVLSRDIEKVLNMLRRIGGLVE